MINQRTKVLTEIHELYKQPEFFVMHALGHPTWSKQREILRSIRDNERTAVRACHGVSKTFTAGEIAVWFFNNFDNPKVITTAPTGMQVEFLLWKEINNMYATARTRLVGECLNVKIKNPDEKDSYAIGFSTDRAERAEGYHAWNILFIFDEAKGIPQWMWDSAQGSMTGGHCRWLVISTTDGVEIGERFYDCFYGQNSSEWNKIHISAFDSPYVTGEKFKKIIIPDPQRPDIFETKLIYPDDLNIQMANKKYIVDGKNEWGEESPLYLTKVRGEISDQGVDTLIKLSHVMKMFDNYDDPEFDKTGAKRAGVDVARGGSDDTVFFKARGLYVEDYKVIPPKKMPEKKKIPWLVDRFEDFINCEKDYYIKVDDTGVGGGFTDELEARGYEKTEGINFAQNPTKENLDNYPGVIDEMWFTLAGDVGEIACPNLPRLQNELINRKHIGMDKKGRRVIEPKKDYKERFKGKSPDMADAFLLMFYNPDGSGGGVTTLDDNAW